MSAHEMMSHAHDAMRMDMRYKLGSYMTSLEHRYGDPRVYEMQREEMAAEQASVIFNDAKTREQALSSTYNQNRKRIREQHSLRMNKPAQDRRPQFLLAGPGDHSDEPPPPEPTPQPATSSARTRATAR